MGSTEPTPRIRIDFAPPILLITCIPTVSFKAFSSVFSCCSTICLLSITLTVKGMSLADSLTCLAVTVMVSTDASPSAGVFSAVALKDKHKALAKSNLLLIL